MLHGINSQKYSDSNGIDSFIYKYTGLEFNVAVGFLNAVGFVSDIQHSPFYQSSITVKF